MKNEDLGYPMSFQNPFKIDSKSMVFKIYVFSTILIKFSFIVD